MPFSLPVFSMFPSQIMEVLGILENQAPKANTSIKLSQIHLAQRGCSLNSLSIQSLPQLQPIVFRLELPQCTFGLPWASVAGGQQLDLVHLCITQHPEKNQCSINVWYIILKRIELEHLGSVLLNWKLLSSSYCYLWKRGGFCAFIDMSWRTIWDVIERHTVLEALSSCGT